jgi:hypothetical protein
MYSKQELAGFGKQASDMFLDHGLPLNDAIVKIASSRPDMTKDHVQRVIENANLITFENMFKGAQSKHVTFELAEPDEVHSMLDHTESIPDPIYVTEPAYAQRTSFLDHIDKEASVAGVPDHVQWRRDYYATKSAASQLEKTAIAIDAEAESQMQKFIEMCKRASLDGAGLRPVLQLAGYASTDEDIFTKVASVTSQALSTTVPHGEYSGVLPNRHHPLYTMYGELEETIKEAQLHKKGLINAFRLHESVKSEEYDL